MLKKNIIRRKQKNTIKFPDTTHPALMKVYAGRNIGSVEELDYSLKNLLPFNLLGNIEKAARLLSEVLEQKKRIVIVADYDADGATACALAIRGLKMMGLHDVQFIVPDRFEHGYGLSPEIVELAIVLNPDLIITVDNGISSVDGVRLARSKGIEVLITDHHLPGPVLPDASVIVNPNLENDSFPSKSLAGVGVLFYVLAALRAELRAKGWFEQQGIAEPNLALFLDLVALGTIADVVPLDPNNRILVFQGLERIRNGLCAAGISALLSVAKRTPAKITSSDLGFSIGPRLNAAGRLTDMRLGIECLICDDRDKAMHMASKLDELNQQRRMIQDEMQSEAIADIEAMDLQSKESLPSGMCLFKENWHQGVIGVLASKIKELTHRPVIAFARDSGELIKGSARSIRDVHIRDAIEAIATAHPGLVLKYGGHAMAAGLSIRHDSFESFCQLFDQEIGRRIKTTGFDSELMSDGELEAKDFSIELAEELGQAGPWGQGFPEPRFDGKFKILSSRIVGTKHLKLQLYLEDKKNPIEAIAFNTNDELWPTNYEEVQTLYRLDVNEYLGRRTPQLIVEHIEPV
ncbi:MAG: single-stranded-DNA-specific exonuclease RecJ [Gammaproteobacteria bacterium]|jgi:single-stranded-DNA-specific exonuclease|nr:single-stranded-DNA-specific exonuclease RecJ [Gammaproteobacteria bacterium]